MAQPENKPLFKVVRSGGRTRYLSPMGKVFTDLGYARGRADAIEADGATATVYVTDTDWKELPQDGLPG